MDEKDWMLLGIAAALLWLVAATRWRLKVAASAACALLLVATVINPDLPGALIAWVLR